MSTTIKSGIPGLQDYEEVLGQALFSRLESFSDRFQATHRELLQPYARKWVIDPLHQWSRQWEYPFMAAAIAGIREQSEGPLAILDAGAGMTFFPHYLLETLPDTSVECCDIDASLAPLYEAVGRSYTRTPGFRVADLTRLPYADQTFDVVYCVSVLEHIPGREAVMAEFARVLKPGGKLVVSFDLSLDGSRDISLPEARLMVAELARFFDGTDTLGVPASGELSAETVFTTTDAGRRDAALLPWPYPALLYQLRGLLQGKGWMRWPPVLTVSCGVLSRKG